MDCQNYIKAELLILVPVLYLIGAGLKKSAFPDRFIPLALGAAGIIMSALWVLSDTNIGGVKDALAAAFAALTQGVLAAGASVYANQLCVQARKEE